MLLHVALTDPPAGTFEALMPRVGAPAVTVTVLLAARRVKPLFDNRRSSYGPGGSEGTANAHDPAACATLGAWVQLTYTHARNAESPAPGSPLRLPPGATRP